MRALRLVVAVALAACGSAPVRTATAPAAGPPPGPAAACPAPAPSIQALVARIDQAYDKLHSDFTPAVFALIELDLAGACAVLELLDAPLADTRLHASRVLEGVLTRRAGFVPGQGFRDRRGDDQARADLADIGYSYDQPLAIRRAAAARWRAWVERAVRSAAPPTTTPSASNLRLLGEARIDGKPSTSVRVELEATGEVLRLRVVPTSFARGELRD